MTESIFNSNDYRRGYNDGYEAGFGNKDKNFVRSGMSVKFALYGNKAIDSYNQGYNAGYERGCYDRQTKDKPQKVEIVTPKTTTIDIKNQNNNLNTFSSMSIQQYSLQKDKLEELKHFLLAFNDDVRQKLMEYKYRVNEMYETGLPEETRNRFEREHIHETEILVNSISRLIEERSVPFTMQNIELMDNLIRLNG